VKSISSLFHQLNILVNESLFSRQPNGGANSPKFDGWCLVEGPALGKKDYVSIETGVRKHGKI
jgi:hypothetical protein